MKCFVCFNEFLDLASAGGVPQAFTCCDECRRVMKTFVAVIPCEPADKEQTAMTLEEMSERRIVDMGYAWASGADIAKVFGGGPIDDPVYAGILRNRVALVDKSSYIKLTGGTD